MNYLSLEELYYNSSEDFRKKNAELFRDIDKSRVPKEKGKNKYNNTKVTVDGVTYDSIKEANRWFELQSMERAGHILYLQRQVMFEVKSGYILNGKKVRNIHMRIDAVYMREGKWIAEDVKPSKKFITRDWLNKAKLFRDLYREWDLEIYI